MLLKAITISAALAVMLSGQVTIPETQAKPSITTEQRARFWRAHAENEAIKVEAKRREESEAAAVEDMKKSCTSLNTDSREYTLGLSPAGEPDCIGKSIQKPVVGKSK